MWRRMGGRKNRGEEFKAVLRSEVQGTWRRAEEKGEEERRGEHKRGGGIQYDRGVKEPYPSYSMVRRSLGLRNRHEDRTVKGHNYCTQRSAAILSMQWHYTIYALRHTYRGSRLLPLRLRQTCRQPAEHIGKEISLVVAVSRLIDQNSIFLSLSHTLSLSLFFSLSFSLFLCLSHSLTYTSSSVFFLWFCLPLLDVGTRTFAWFTPRLWLRGYWLTGRTRHYLW